MRAGEHDSSNRPLRVMHVLGGRVRSGVETFLLTLAEVQRREGHEPIFVPLAEGPFTEEARDLGFRIVPLLKRRRLDVLSIPRLARLIRDHKPDVLHSYAVNGAFYACPAGRMLGFPAHVGHFQADTEESLEDVIRWRLPRSLANKYHIWLTR
jgi:hypothetical protein